MARIVIKEGYEVKPEGLYYLQVRNVLPKIAEKGPAAGNTFLSWEADVIDGPETTIGETYNFITPAECSPKSKYYKIFEAVGFALPEGERELILDTKDLIGKEFIAEVTVIKNADRDKNVFKNVWNLEEYANFQRKAKTLESKVVSQKRSVDINTTKVVSPNIKEQKDISFNSKLTDFPE